MGEFKKFGGFKGKSGGFRGRDSGRPSFGGGRPSFSGGRDRGERSEMFSTTCDQCGKQCEVPFRPSGSKPVYCNDCFGGKRDAASEYGTRTDAPRYEKKDSFSFGASAKPAHASGGSDKQVEELKRQVEALHTKVDKLIALFQKDAPVATPVHAPKVEAVVKATAPAAVVVKEVTKKAPVKKAAAPTKEAKKSTPAKKATPKKK